MSPSFLLVVNGAMGKMTLQMPIILQRVRNECKLKSYLHEKQKLDVVICLIWFCISKLVLNLTYPAGSLPAVQQISLAG